MKQKKGILFVSSKPAEDSSVLAKKNKLAFIAREMSSFSLGFPQVPEKWVKVLAVDEDYADALLWEAWNDNYKAIDSLNKEHMEISKNMAKYNFLPDSDEMEKLIRQFEETNANLESRFQEQESLYKSIIDSPQAKQEIKIDRKKLGWHNGGTMIDGKYELIRFPDELPSELFEGKAENDIIAFTYDDIEFVLTIKEKLYGYDESIFSEDEDILNQKNDAVFSTFAAKEKVIIPIPIIGLAVLGGLGLAGLVFGFFAGAAASSRR